MGIDLFTDLERCIGYFVKEAGHIRCIYIVFKQTLNMCMLIQIMLILYAYTNKHVEICGSFYLGEWIAGRKLIF